MQKLEGTSSAVSGGPKAIITVTVYNKVSWSAGALARASQHVLLSSQTLGDLIDIIPCVTARNFSRMNEQAGHEAAGDTDNGCVICIENVAYGDGRSAVDYARYVFLSFGDFPKFIRPKQAFDPPPGVFPRLSSHKSRKTYL